jgi:hypothetical protein
MKAYLRVMAENKVSQEQVAKEIAENSKNPIERQLARALEKSNRIMAEDCLREAGYMLPQSEEVRAFLKGLLETDQVEDFPKEAVEELLQLLG